MSPKQLASLALADDVGVFQPTRLPCGLHMQNRLVKVAMYEHLATFFGGPPNEHHFHLYSEWAQHDWGMVVTGNMQISPEHLSLGRDVVLPKSNSKEELLRPFQRLADCIHGLYDSKGKKISSNHNNILAFMQINHTGRQSSNIIGGRLPFRPPMAPSPIPVGLSGNAPLASNIINSVMFQTPKEMTQEDIREVLENFVDGAVLAFKTGFDGVQLHAAHGYLLSQFLSPKTNTRVDQYSCDKFIEIIRHIVQRIRLSTGQKFAICIKINSSDYMPSNSSGDETLIEAERAALKHILAMSEWGLIDVIEISGGDYESPDFMTTQDSPPKSTRQVFFARFSHEVLKALDSRKSVKVTPPLILLTGGLRSPRLLRSALTSRHADLLGIGRGSILCPDFPSVARVRLKYPELWDDVSFQQEPSFKTPRLFTYRPFDYLWDIISRIKLIGAGVTLSWYIVSMRNIANSYSKGRTYAPNPNVGGMQSMLSMWIWTTDWSWIERWMMILVTLALAVIYGTVQYTNLM